MGNIGFISNQKLKMIIDVFMHKVSQIRGIVKDSREGILSKNFRKFNFWDFSRKVKG